MTCCELVAVLLATSWHVKIVCHIANKSTTCWDGEVMGKHVSWILGIMVKHTVDYVDRWMVFVMYMNAHQLLQPRWRHPLCRGDASLACKKQRQELLAGAYWPCGLGCSPTPISQIGPTRISKKILTILLKNFMYCVFIRRIKECTIISISRTPQNKRIFCGGGTARIGPPDK